MSRIHRKAVADEVKDLLGIFKPRKIEIKCTGCGLTHTVRRDANAPPNAISMVCNWCSSCSHKADDYYEESYVLKEDEPEFVDPNQLDLFGG